MSELPAGRVVVAGLGVSGFAAADALLDTGVPVTVVDTGPAPAGHGDPAGVADARSERVRVLDVLGADLQLGPGAAADPAGLLAGTGLLVTSPGWRPAHPLLSAAESAGVPVWSEAELAWRLRPAGAAPWLCVTGTNGKTTTVELLAAILAAAGLATRAAGNIGTPLVEAVRDPAPLDALAVELSSFQLHYTHSVSALAAACLNVAPDHLDWHGSYEAYRADKGRVYERAQRACVHNVADPQTEDLVRAADVVEGCRAVGFTTGVPAPGQLGVVDGALADRAFVDDPRRSAAELASIADLAHLAGGDAGTDGDAPDPSAGVAPHVLANALAAASLARAAGVPPAAVRDGLRAAGLPPHRAAAVAVWRGVSFVDDSKATNPHAAAASLASAADIVWVAGGDAKGAGYDDLVRQAAGRLRAAVLIGRDRELVAAALARHAPDVPVVRVDRPDTGDVATDTATYLDRVVSAAAGRAAPGSTVLLAPAASSLDEFDSYAARGDAFAAAVRRHVVAAGGPAPPAGERP